MGRPPKQPKEQSEIQEEEENSPENTASSPSQTAERALSLIINEINGVKGKNKPSIIKMDYLGRMVALDIPAISSGSIALDAALGIGGYAVGRIIEIFGAASVGKTTLCLHAIAEAQKAGLTCAYVDMEGSVDPGYAAALGVDINKLLFSQPASGDEAMEIVDKLVKSGLVGLIAVDSVSALTTRAELEKEITDNNIGQQARLMSQSLKRLSPECNKSKTTIIFINQIRMKIGCVSPETRVLCRLTNESDS